jgi:hypothetical protein
LDHFEAYSQKEWAFYFLMFNALRFTCLPQADVSFEPSALSFEQARQGRSGHGDLKVRVDEKNVENRTQKRYNRTHNEYIA